jgi:elongation factor 1-alpha
VCSDPLNDPAREAASFLAYIFVLEKECKIEKDYISDIYCHTCKIACKFVEIISKHHRRNGKLLEKVTSLFYL